MSFDERDDGELPPPAEETARSRKVRQAVGGDDEAQTWVIEYYSPYLLLQAKYRIAPSLRRHLEPEDLVALTWEAALPKLPDLEARKGTFRTSLMKFLSTILLRRYNNLVQKHLCGKPQLVESVGDSDESDGFQISAAVTGVVTRAVRQETTALLVSCLEELSDSQREILILRLFEQHSNAEAAELLGTTPNAAAARFMRARESLSQTLRSRGLGHLAFED